MPAAQASMQMSRNLADAKHVLPMDVPGTILTKIVVMVVIKIKTELLRSKISSRELQDALMNLTSAQLPHMVSIQTSLLFQILQRVGLIIM